MPSAKSGSSAVVCAFKRSPMHFANKGALAKVRPDDMAAEVVKALVAASGVKPADIEDLIMGCAFPEAEQGFNIARLVVNHADLPVTAGGATPLARVDLTIALSVVLLGMLAMIARRNAISQVIGLLSLENGLILAAIGVVGMPLVVELSTAALVLMLAVVAAVVVFQIRDRLDTLDTSILDRQRGDA